MSQLQVAQALGVNKSTVGNWEVGRTQPGTRLTPLMDFLREHSPHSPTTAPPQQQLAAPPDPVRTLSDGALWAEIDERMAEAKRRYYVNLQEQAANARQLPVTQDLPDHLTRTPPTADTPPQEQPGKQGNASHAE